MIKININKAYIPIPFMDDNGETVFELRFYKTDENIEKIMNFDTDLLADDEKKLENMEDQREFIKDIVDTTLGEGAFDKMYDLDGSLYNVVGYFEAIVEGIVKELGYGDVEEALEKYKG